MAERASMASELEARKLWALRVLGNVVSRGRTAGWLSGELVDLDHLEELPLDHGRTPMRVLQDRLALEESELDVLWLLSCIELDPLIAKAAQCLASPGMHELNAQILEQLVERGSCSLTRLDQLGLVEVGGDFCTPLFRRSVRPNDRVLDLARGLLRLDPSVERARLLERTPGGSPEYVPVEIDRALTFRSNVVILARGATGSGRAHRMVNAAHTRGINVIRVDGANLATEQALERHVRALARECLLHDAVLLIDAADELGSKQVEVERVLSSFPAPVLLTCSRTSSWSTQRMVVTFDVETPDEGTRAAQWKASLPMAPPEVISYAARYRLGPEMIRHTADAALMRVRRPDQLTTSDLQSSVCAQLQRRFGQLARRVETKQTWQDLVLPLDQLELLLELVSRIRFRSTVLDSWEFGAKIGRGLGLAVLLSGPPGTGKTMIGGLLARELDLDLYQVDLSQIVSKYIGETEKQLGAVFDAAEAGNAILLFDEADSLFAKRTEVKSSNDRYANLEVNYLLQRIEAFEGICLLTTNHEHGIDPAFQRRLAAHIRIPLPDREHRERIWRAMLPESAEVRGELDFHGLSELPMSGGYIKNAVLRSAYLAVASGSPITSEFLWKAARLEYEASGKLMRDVG